MATTPILGITQVTASQNTKEVTINDAIIALEAATNAKLDLSYAAVTTILLSDTQATRNFIFVAKAGTANSILRFPNVVNGNNLNRVFAVRNESGFQLTVKFNTGAGTTVIIPNGATRLIDAMDGLNMIVAAEPATVVTFVDLTDTPSSYVGQAGRFLTANLAETALEFTDAAVFPSFVGNEGKYLMVNATADGVQWDDITLVAAFTDLTDTPNSLTGQGNKIVSVNSAGTALEFITMPEAEAVTFAAAQRWRIYITEPGGMDEVGFGEIEFLDVDGIDLVGTGTASASSFMTGKEAEFAFDGNTDAGAGWMSAALFGAFEWIEYEFTGPEAPRQVRIYPITDFPDYSPARFKIERFDGATWVEAGERIPDVWVSGASQTFKINGVPLESFPDAPSDGTTYGRKDAAWVAVTADYPPFTGNADKVLAVNDTEDGVEWVVPSGGSGGPSVIDTVATTSTNLLAAQASKYIRFTADTAKTVTVQTDATEPMPANGEWTLYNEGDTDLTITAVVGVTITPPANGTLVIPSKAIASLKRVAADTFDLLGQTVAATDLAVFPTLTGNAGKLLAVNATEDNVEWVSIGDGAVSLTATGTGASQDITLPASGLLEAQVLVFVNGIRYETDEYAIAGTTLTLTTNAAGDSIEIVVVNSTSGAANPWWFNPPSAASFSLLSGDGTVPVLTDDADEGLLFDFGAYTAADDNRFAYRTLTTPASDWVMTVAFKGLYVDGNYGFGFALRDSTSGRFTTFNTRTTGWRLFNWTNMTTYSAVAVTSIDPSTVTYKGLTWLRIARVGANLQCWVSANGKQWLQLMTYPIASFLVNSPNQIGLNGTYATTTYRGFASVAYFSLTGPAV